MITLKQIKQKLKQKLKKQSPTCENSYEPGDYKRLLKSLSKTKADDTIVTAKHLLETLGVCSTLQIIDYCIEDKQKARLMRVEFNESALRWWKKMEESQRKKIKKEEQIILKYFK